MALVTDAVGELRLVADLADRLRRLAERRHAYLGSHLLHGRFVRLDIVLQAPISIIYIRDHEWRSGIPVRK